MGEIREDILKLLIMGDAALAAFYFIGMWLGMGKYRRGKRQRQNKD